ASLRDLPSFPTRRSSDLAPRAGRRRRPARASRSHRAAHAGAAGRAGARWFRPAVPGSRTVRLLHPPQCCAMIVPISDHFMQWSCTNTLRYRGGIEKGWKTGTGGIIVASDWYLNGSGKGDLAMNRNSTSLVAAAIALALYGPGSPAAAQTRSPDAPGEEIVVTGVRGSLEAALEIKRNATGLVDAITAEDVGKFPDKNLAEALQRVPGIVINREFGEGERVSLRGTGTNLTRTLLNGHGLATADWFILDQLNTT